MFPTRKDNRTEKNKGRGLGGGGKHKKGIGQIKHVPGRLGISGRWECGWENKTHNKTKKLLYCADISLRKDGWRKVNIRTKIEAMTPETPTFREIQLQMKNDNGAQKKKDEAYLPLLRR